MSQFIVTKDSPATRRATLAETGSDQGSVGSKSTPPLVGLPDDEWSESLRADEGTPNARKETRGHPRN